MNFKYLSSDIKSGIVVFLVALPLCLGIALACGVPLFSGIIAGVIGGLVVTSISDAKYSVSGPAAGLTAIVLAGVSEIGGFQYFVAAGIFAGVLQLILGALKAGGLGNYIPNSVIKGMLAGIGIILIIKQVPHMVGYDSDPEGDLYFFQKDGHNTLSDLYYMLNYITPGSVVVGLLSFFTILFSETGFYKKHKIFSNIPGPLLVVLLGVLLTLTFANIPLLHISSEHLVSLPKINSFGDLKATLITPDFSKWNDQAFWILVVTLATVASIETLLSI
ncbi:MAG: SulP family inorganic anion transporter, partial [Bacteroidia bacterium]|nr:SulP family inorganic anion transporter [Bacteroidia bacterium]